jgi:hypothetical protein
MGIEAALKTLFAVEDKRVIGQEAVVQAGIDHCEWSCGDKIRIEL